MLPPISTIVLTTGFLLMLIGLWGIFSHRNILRIIIGVSLFGTGIHIVMVAIGYVARGTAPIVGTGITVYSNPLPHVLILTAIVVGIATLALGLALVVRIRESYGSVEEDEIQRAEESARRDEAT